MFTVRVITGWNYFIDVILVLNTEKLVHIKPSCLPDWYNMWCARLFAWIWPNFKLETSDIIRWYLKLSLKSFSGLA
jgi:hypothetical protein